MSPALEAAFRLACTLPKTTHEQRKLEYMPGTRGGYPEVLPGTVKRMRELSRKGMPRYRIALDLGLSSKTVTKYLGARPCRMPSRRG